MNAFFIRVASLCVLGLLFLSQFTPTAYIEIKAGLLAIGVFFVFISMVRHQLFLLRWQVIGITFLVIFGLFYSLYGQMRGNPGAFRVLSVFFIWPLIFLSFSALLSQSNSYIWLCKTFIAALIAVVVYSYIYLGNVAGVIPDYLYFELDQGQNVGFYEGYTEYNLYSISSLIFLIPFYFHYLLEKYKRTKFISWRLLLLALIAFVLALLTGRRAMILVLLLMPLVIIFSNKLLENKYPLKINFSGTSTLFIFGAIFTSLFAIFGLDYNLILDMFADGFDFSSSSNASASERYLQFHALIDGWLNSSILFGAGNGAAAAISRSDEMPWAYELTYVYLLFSTGLVGVLAYFSWYGYGLKQLRRAMQERPDLVLYSAPMLTGSISLCIAAATNPYFGKFDYLWIVLLPFLIAGWAKYQNPVQIK